MASLDDLYSPALIHSVNGLALISRNIVDSYLTGVNHSIRTGFGMEFSQYRQYEPGDDLRMLDWKLAARHEKLYVRQSEIESNTPILFILDSSGSMSQQTDSISKIDAGRILISTLAYLGNRQGDALGLFIANEKESYHLTPARKRQQYQQILNGLINAECIGSWSGNIKIPHLGRNKTMIIVVSDFYQNDNELIDSVLNINQSSNDIVCIQISSGLEWNPSIKKGSTLMDLETGKRISLSDSFSIRAYMDRWQEYREGIRRKLLENHIRHMDLRTDIPLPPQLKLMLDQHAMS